MAGRRGERRGPRPGVEPLDGRLLLTAAPKGLGPYLAPAAILPRATAAAKAVDPHTAENQLLQSLLGPSIVPVQNAVAADSVSTRNGLADRVLSQPFLQAILSRQDTYTLLSGGTFSNLIGSQLVGTQAQDAQSFTVTLPQGAITAINSGLATVQVPATPGVSGYYVQVPTANIRTFGDGTASVQVPRSALPRGAAVPSVMAIPTGSLSQVYADNGPLIADALRSTAPRPTPNTPRSVPGLRLSNVLGVTHGFPIRRSAIYLRILRLAVDRGVFSLTADQQAKVSAGVDEFNGAVASLNRSGTFTPSVPPAPPTLPNRPLDGTLMITAGAFRRLASVAPALTGLQLPGVGNFPGRLDVGYLFDRNGNYGLVLRARGALLGAPAGIASTDTVGGDIQVEVSNARSLDSLTGLSVVEGLTVGSARSAAVTASRTDTGVTTFAGAAGYGTGLEFGTGRAYTQVIPLGNVFALIPSAPAS